MGCSNCPYTGGTIVKNQGYRTSDIVFVGEAPGSQELKEGKPFVGPTGILLKRILEHTGIVGASFANAIRCDIGDKTDTKKVNAGLKQCKEYLDKFISAIQPKLIVALGDFAMRQVLGKRKITENRGRFFDSELGKVFVTFHPAYMLRLGMTADFALQTDPNIKMYLNDFAAIKSYLEAGRTQELSVDNYRKASRVSLGTTKVVGFDVETTVSGGPHREATRLLSLGLSGSEGHADVVIGSKVPESVKKILESKDTVKYVAARPFDEVVMLNKAGVRMQNTHDVLTMAHVLNENLPRYNLETVAEVYGNMKGIKSLSEGMRLSLEEAEERVLVQYNGVDADAALRTGKNLALELKARPNLYRYYAKFLYPVQNMFAEISHHGCKVDTQRLRDNEQEALRLIQQYEQDALECIPERIKKEYSDNLKLSRNDLVIDFLFRSPYGLNLNPVLTTPKTKSPAVTEEHFKYLPQDIRFIQKYLQHKKVSKIYGTYLKNLWEEIHEDGRVYPSTLFTRTVTGRTVMLRPAIQTIPQRGEFASLVKSAFVADRGWYLGSRDLAQSELRIIGWLAGDPNILSALREGIDLHTKTAMVITGKRIEDISKLDRQRAKPVGFGKHLTGFNIRGTV